MKKYYVSLLRNQNVLIEACSELSESDVQNFIDKLNIYSTDATSDYILPISPAISDYFEIDKIDLSKFTHVYSINSKSLEELDFLIAVSALRERKIAAMREETSLEEQTFRNSLNKNI